jgi:hypothetical protein
MKTPRLALLVLWSALAPVLALAGQSWDPVLNDGDQWWGVVFTDENGTKRTYWARTAEAKATKDGEVKLYALMKKNNAAVTGGTYYESVASAYTMKVAYHAGTMRGRQTVGAYTITRDGTSLALPAKLGWSLGESIWNSEHPQTKPGGTKTVRVNPYIPGTLKVVVAAPGDQVETLTATPMTHFSVGVRPTKWTDYYFDREPPAKPTGFRSPDPNASYRQAMSRFAGMHQRVHPFEVVLNPSPTLCFVIPENCVDKENKKKFERFITAGDQAAAGNLLPTEALAVEAHAHFKGVAEGLRENLKSAPEHEFGPDETRYIQRLLANAGKSVEFQREMNASRGDPAKLKLFVKKWRTFLAKENDAYLSVVDTLGGKEVERKPLLAAAVTRVETTLKPPLSKSPAPSNKPKPKEQPSAAVVGLTANELKWLTKREATDYAKDIKNAKTSDKPKVVKNYRDTIVENLKPAAASATYAALVARASTAKALDAALPAEVWGGDNKEVVAEFGTKTDIQLSDVEFKTLSGDAKYAKALTDYRNDRRGTNGHMSSVDEKPEFGAANYDPIALHLATMGARKHLPVVTPVTPPLETPKQPPKPARLNALEVSLLTPSERKAYFKTYLEQADRKVPDAEANLQRESDRLRGLIASENRSKDKPYAAPADIAAFKDLPAWHKKVFCDPAEASAAMIAEDDAAATMFAPGSEALKALSDIERELAKASMAGLNGAAAQNGKPLPDWAVVPCKDFRRSLGGGGNNKGGGGGNNLTVENRDGSGKDIVLPKAKEYVSRALLIQALQGGIVGVLVGALFGPVGLVAGPLLGAALYYGTAWADKNKPKDKDK